MDLSKLQNGSDVRGVALAGVENEPVTLDDAAVRAIAGGFARFLRARLGKESCRVSVGRDSRLSGGAIAETLCETLAACGAEVTDLGLCTTPAMFMTTVTGESPFDAAVMITASHLPWNRNGLKFFTAAGGAESADVREILRLAAEETPLAPGGSVAQGEVMETYAAILREKIIAAANGNEKPLAGKHIVVDAGNGAGGFFAERTPGAASVDNAFVNSFLGGYSTGDVLVSFLAAGVFFDSIKRKGYEGEAFRKAHVRACLIAAVCLAIVYGGLLYMGACVSTEYTPDSISNANLLLSIIRSSGGQIAIYGLCLSVVLACLTTAISQITAVADFYETATHGKLSYKVLVMIVPIVTTIVASFGLDTIVSLTSPWFSFFYPITLVMTILGIFEKKIPNDGAFKGAVYFTVIYAVLDLPHEYGFGFLDPVLNHIPLYGLGFGWIVPAIVGFIVGLIAWKGKGRTET